MFRLWLVELEFHSTRVVPSRGVPKRLISSMWVCAAGSGTMVLFFRLCCWIIRNQENWLHSQPRQPSFRKRDVVFDVLVLLAICDFVLVKKKIRPRLPYYTHSYSRTLLLSLFLSLISSIVSLFYPSITLPNKTSL